MSLSLDAARAEALFCSELSCACTNSADEVRAAIRAQVAARGGSRGCACQVAYEYGEHPDTARDRMAWARREVNRVFHGGDTEWAVAA